MGRPFDPRHFDEEVLKANGIVSAFGVPDSSLSGLLSYFYTAKPTSDHVVMANEGGAITLATGYYLSTGCVALAYMQNSGFANALNPLQSLASKEVFGIPMLLMIGWRGRPGEKDEPQHALVGPRILDNLEANGLPYEELPDSISEARETVARLVARALQDNTPVALIVPNKTFLPYNGETRQQILPKISANHARLERWTSSLEGLPLSRELAIRCILRHVKPTDITVSSLGGNSREVYMVFKESGVAMGRNFFCIGAMGHTSALACGIAMGFSLGRVFCIDGDGSFLMHVGNSAVLANVSQRNVIHIVIYNGVHSSTGSHSLMIERDSFLALAEGLPYRQKFLVDSAEGLERACQSAGGNALIVVAVNDSVRKHLPRPTESPQELKQIFMKYIALSKVDEQNKQSNMRAFGSNILADYQNRLR